MGQRVREKPARDSNPESPDFQQPTPAKTINMTLYLTFDFSTSFRIPRGCTKNYYYSQPYHYLPITITITILSQFIISNINITDPIDARRPSSLLESFLFNKNEVVIILSPRGEFPWHWPGSNLIFRDGVGSDHVPYVACSCSFDR